MRAAHREAGHAPVTLIVAATLAVACGKSSTPTASQPAAASAPPVAAAPLVELRPLEISFRGQPIARLFADGRTESAGKNAPGTLAPGPTLHADGTIAMTKGGVTARLDANGDIYVVNPGAEPLLFGHIAGDELAFAGDPRPWSVRVRGDMIEFGEDDSSQIDGEVTPSVRHTALVMAAAFYIDGAIAAR
jgi:hypothetical protein